MNTNLTIGPRPSHDDIAANAIGPHFIMSLLKPSEGSKELADFCRTHGYAVYNFPLVNGYRGEHSAIPEFIDAARILMHHLDRGPVYLHCHSGVHRSGAVAYCYYRETMPSWGHQEAWDAVVYHRPIIARQMGDNLDFLVRYYG